jgi:broad specificity phosphatase PhoE
MHLYVIRHGQSFVNLNDWDGKDPDMPLTPLGEQQAEALAAWLPGHLPNVDAIYCSTLSRANHTATILGKAYNTEVVTDSRLREIGNNRIDHTPWPTGTIPPQSDWAAYWPTERPFSKVAQSEGAESAMHFRIRVASFIEDTLEKHPKQTVIAVCHGGVMDAVFDYCFGVGPWRRCEVWTTNTGVTHFEYVAIPGRETWRLYEHNLIEHLRAANMLS